MASASGEAAEDQPCAWPGVLAQGLAAGMQAHMLTCDRGKGH